MVIHKSVLYRPGLLDATRLLCKIQDGSKLSVIYDCRTGSKPVRQNTISRGYALKYLNFSDRHLFV